MLILLSVLFLLGFFGLLIWVTVIHICYTEKHNKDALLEASSSLELEKDQVNSMLDKILSR